MKPKQIDPDEVFANLKRKREDGSLSKSIANGESMYQASRTHPGMLERVLPNGSVEVGEFIDGSFKCLDGL